MARKTERKIKTATVPGVGRIIYVEQSTILASSERVMPMLLDPRYADSRRPVENEHLDTIRRHLRLD